jgi:protein-tyrosine phosphatase
MTVDAQFRLLYVCVGNVCRSVLAERMTRHELGVLHPARFCVASAGTRGLARAPMHPYTEHLLADRAADTSGFAARRLTPTLIAHADLVLTATVRERDDVLALVPTAIRRTFTITEFAPLAARSGHAEKDPVEHARKVVIDALRRRGQVRSTVDGDDIPDPDRTVEAFSACAATVERAVRAIVPALCGPGTGDA